MLALHGAVESADSIRTLLVAFTLLLVAFWKIILRIVIIFLLIVIIVLLTSGTATFLHHVQYVIK